MSYSPRLSLSHTPPGHITFSSDSPIPGPHRLRLRLRFDLPQSASEYPTRSFYATLCLSTPRPPSAQPRTRSRSRSRLTKILPPPTPSSTPTSCEKWQHTPSVADRASARPVYRAAPAKSAAIATSPAPIVSNATSPVPTADPHPIDFPSLPPLPPRSIPPSSPRLFRLPTREQQQHQQRHNHHRCSTIIPMRSPPSPIDPPRPATMLISPS